MHRFIDWLMLMAVVAIIFLLVRPKSLGPQLASTFTNGIISLFSTVTGGGKWA